MADNITQAGLIQELVTHAPINNNGHHEPEISDNPARFEFTHISKVLQPRAPIVWRVEKLLAEGYLSIWFGEAGSKKSWSLLDLAICAATGKPWLDFQTVQCPVLWIDEEMGENRMLDRLQSVADGHFADVNTIPLYYASYKRFDFLNDEFTAGLHNQILQHGAGIVIVDALREVVPADENSAREMKPALLALDAIAKQTGAAIVIIHHANKSGDYSGTTALKSSADSMVKIESKPDSPNIDFETEKARDTESLKFSAVANFGPGQFWLSSSDKLSTPKLSKSQNYVIRYLLQNGISTIAAIMDHVEGCTENAARAALYNLSPRFTKRVDAGSKGEKAEYDLTEEAREKFNNFL